MTQEPYITIVRRTLVAPPGWKYLHRNLCGLPHAKLYENKCRILCRFLSEFTISEMEEEMIKVSIWVLM